jgi:hypothetical protein
MAEKEFEALVEDIKANGVREKITLYAFKILDGRNRYRAGLKAGYAFGDRDFETLPSGTDPLKFVISANIVRRHLDETQRGMVAAKLATMKRGDNQHTKEDGSIDLSTAAKLLNVSEKTVKRAKAVFQNGEDGIIADLQAGKLRLGAVTKDILDLEKGKQALTLNQQKADRSAKAKASYEARKGGGKPSVSAANQPMDKVNAIVKMWDGLEEIQQESFVDQRRPRIEAILMKMKQKEGLIKMEQKEGRRA